jgi:peptidylprolyl isomerase
MNRKNFPLLFLAASLPATMLFAACGGDDDDDDDPAPTNTAAVSASPNAERTATRAASPSFTGAIVLKNPTTTPSGLQFEDTVVGTGASPKAGQQVTVHYTGTFPSGQKFDSSRDSGKPFSFIIGNGNVIKGWDEGVLSMKVGGKRNLLVPPALGYGARDYGPIPGGSTLLFEVELLSVQ